MGTPSTSRRTFLRNALGMVVIAGATPMTVLGRILPEISFAGKGKIIATYTIKLSDYPELAEVGGSIRLTAPEELKLNPDHVTYSFNDMIFPIAITRVADSGTDMFKAVSTYCTHGFGFQIGPYNAEKDEFVCPHNRSTFRADGTHVDKPNTPNVGDLRKFPVIYDADAGTITLQQVLEVAGLDRLDLIPSRLFLDQNYPNPFNPSTMIRYGLPEASQVKIIIHSLVGSFLRVVFDKPQEAGIHIFDLNASDLPSGVYFYRLQTDLGTLTRRMTISK